MAKDMAYTITTFIPNLLYILAASITVLMTIRGILAFHKKDQKRGMQFFIKGCVVGLTLFSIGTLMPTITVLDMDDIIGDSIWQTFGFLFMLTIFPAIASQLTDELTKHNERDK